MDLHNLSSHKKDARLIKLTAEDALGRMEDDIKQWRKKILPEHCSMEIAEGNHDWRIKSYVENNAPYAAGLISVPDRLLLREKQIKWHPYGAGQTIRLGGSKLYYTHAPMFGGETAARRTLLACQHNILFGHLHQRAFAEISDGLGEHKAAWGIGCLCDKNDPAMHYMKNWRNFRMGFVVVDIYPDKMFHVQNVQIIRYQCTVDGKRFKG